jgi:branched-chain amino acid transport system permease protein
VIRPTSLAFAVAIAGLAMLPIAFNNEYVMHVAILAMIFAILCASWNLVAGYAGIFTFGHQAFFALGAYASALLAMRANISPWITMPLGALVAGLFGTLISLPVLRLKGKPYVAIMTLAFAEIVRIVGDNITDLTNGETGLAGVPPLTGFALPGGGLATFSLADRTAYFYVALILLVGTVAVLGFIVRGPMGLALKAIRESQEAAESLGVPLTAYKTFAFAVSSALAGLAGAFYAHYVGILTPSSVAGVDVMVQIIGMTVVGGLATFYGPVIGAFALTVSLELLRSAGNNRFLIYGALIVLAIMFIPDGLASLPKRAARVFLKGPTSWKPLPHPKV